MLVVGTRGSKLALAQTEIVIGLLRAAYPELTCKVRVIASLGDRVTDKPLDALATQGIFTHALESALLRGEIDLAVHSAKDLPSTLAPGLELAAVPVREDARDCLVSAGGLALVDLPPRARIGTGSPRRTAQIALIRPDLRIEPIRGNVDTRRRAALDGVFDAVALAAAGLLRLGLLDNHVVPIEPEVCLPQAGQGAIAVEALESRTDLREMGGTIEDACTRACLDAERATLAGLAAGCQAPVAAFAEPCGGGQIRLRALVAAVNGAPLRAEAGADWRDAVQLGRTVADELRARGADEALRRPPSTRSL